MINDCKQENCPFRNNDTTSVWGCKYVACPNRDNGNTWYATDHTEAMKDGKGD